MAFEDRKGVLLVLFVFTVLKTCQKHHSETKRPTLSNTLRNTWFINLSWFIYYLKDFCLFPSCFFTVRDISNGVPQISRAGATPSDGAARCSAPRARGSAGTQRPSVNERCEITWPFLKSLGELGLQTVISISLMGGLEHFIFFHILRIIIPID